MNYKHIFLLGRPGCGKSALYRELERGLLQSGRARTCQRVDDFPKLWAWIEADYLRESEGKERLFTAVTEDGHFDISDYDFLERVLNEILGEVSADVLEIDRPDHVVVIEFARHSYLEALEHFDRSILDSCLIVYMQVSFETCWERNVARHQAAVAQGGDDHLVPRESMERYYLHDDRDQLIQVMTDRGIPVEVVDNEREGEEHLVAQVESLFGRLI
jgi:hypothetical protein